MTQIALLTDTHAGVRNDNPAFHDYQRKCFDWFFSHIDKHNIKHCIHLGDIYDKRKGVNFMSAKRVREDFLDRLEQRGITSHIIQGNHDSYWKNTHEVNALDELVAGRYRNITTHSVPSIIDVDGLAIQMMPWITESNHKEAMKAIKNPKAEVLMGHLELSGFEMHKGTKLDHGMDRLTFEKFDKVFTGHYHHRSTIGNVTYIGAFAEYTWSDYDDDRGFSIFDTETRQLAFLKNPYRIFRLARYDDVANPNIVEKIQTTDFSKYANTYVKLVIVNKANPYAFDLLFDSIYKVSPLDIQVIDDPTLLLESEEYHEVDQAEDTPTILTKYIEHLTLPVEGSKVRDFMLDVYNEALSMESE